MRRKDREMDVDFARMVLDKCEYAVLGMAGPEGWPYNVPVTIVRRGEELFFHCALEGQKVDCLRRDGRVCVTAVGDTHIPPDKFTTEYESAVAFGLAEEVTDPAEKTEALRLLCQRHVPSNMGAFEASVARSLGRTGVWRVRLTGLTGKRKKYGAAGKEMKFGRME